MDVILVMSVVRMKLSAKSGWHVGVISGKRISGATVVCQKWHDEQQGGAYC